MFIFNLGNRKIYCSYQDIPDDQGGEFRLQQWPPGPRLPSGVIRKRVGEVGPETGEADDMKCLLLHHSGQAEVQAVFSDGAVSLHTRSLKYGKVSWALFLFADRDFRSIFESPEVSGILT